MAPRTKPPFRADMVGSLLRTKPLKDAREKYAKGEISKAALTEVEDREIKTLIKKQGPTANFAAPGGTTTSSACSKA